MIFSQWAQDDLRASMARAAQVECEALRNLDLEPDGGPSRTFDQAAAIDRRGKVKGALRLGPCTIDDLGKRLPGMKKSEIGGALKSLSMRGVAVSDKEHCKSAPRVWRLAVND